jgi:hypothetical protein
MAEDNNFEIVRNADPSIVKEAQSDVGVVFKGEDEAGVVLDGDIKVKPNAKEVKRINREEYNPEKDNTPQTDTNPYSLEIKNKNDKARERIIPLLNSMSKSGGIRLDAINQELQKELNNTSDPEKLAQLKLQLDTIARNKELAQKGRDGIVFPPREVDEIK